MYHRDLFDVVGRQLFKGKVIILFGPRRGGKTTLSKAITDSISNSRYLNCELLEHKRPVPDVLQFIQSAELL